MLPWGKIFMPFPVEARNLAAASIKCSLLPTSVAFLPSYKWLDIPRLQLLNRSIVIPRNHFTHAISLEVHRCPV